MPDNKHKMSIPKIIDVGTFHQRFGTDEACLKHLEQLRWGENLERFKCPGCGHGRGWWLGHRKLVECTTCHKVDEPEEHYTESVCVSCHTDTKDWETFHFDHTGYTDCKDCHGGPSEHYLGSCSTCHTSLPATLAT